MSASYQASASFQQRFRKAVQKSLEETAAAVMTDVKDAGVMPMDKGVLQNQSTFVDDSESAQGIVRIVSDTPYARRLYYHPEYNFRTSENENAGGKWLEPWLSGEKKDFAANAFQTLMQRNF